MNPAAWLDGSTDAALARTRADRDAAEQRIVDLQGKRDAELSGAGDLSAISIIDASIDAARQTIKIADERLVIIERDARRLAAARRESRRTAAVGSIEKRLAKRTALAGELETAIARVVAIAEQIADTDAIKKPWSGDGIARALPAGPRLPNDLQSLLARNADFILSTLRNLPINEPDADAEMERVA
jgi:hypothetical protein